MFNAIEIDQRIKIKNEKNNIDINLVFFFLYISLAFINSAYDAREIIRKRLHPPYYKYLDREGVRDYPTKK